MRWLLNTEALCTIAPRITAAHESPPEDLLRVDLGVALESRLDLPSLRHRHLDPVLRHGDVPLQRVDARVL